MPHYYVAFHFGPVLDCLGLETEAPIDTTPKILGLAHTIREQLIAKHGVRNMAAPNVIITTLLEVKAPNKIVEATTMPAPPPPLTLSPRP